MISPPNAFTTKSFPPKCCPVIKSFQPQMLSPPNAFLPKCFPPQMLSSPNAFLPKCCPLIKSFQPQMLSSSQCLPPQMLPSAKCLPPPTAFLELSFSTPKCCPHTNVSSSRSYQIFTPPNVSPLSGRSVRCKGRRAVLLNLSSSKCFHPPSVFPLWSLLNLSYPRLLSATNVFPLQVLSNFSTPNVFLLSNVFI